MVNYSNYGKLVAMQIGYGCFTILVQLRFIIGESDDISVVEELTSPNIDEAVLI